MTFHKHSFGAKFLLLFALIPMLILSACGGSTGSSTGRYIYPDKSADNSWEQT